MEAVAEDRWGFELPVLLLGAFRAITDELHAELARRGHPDARPTHALALQAVGVDGVSVSELGRRLGVTKQAAAKTAACLVERGYAARRPDATDRRAALVHRTERGTALLALSAEIFQRLRTRWVADLGADRLVDLEASLATLAGISGRAHPAAAVGPARLAGRSSPGGSGA
ncbi:MarR family winged helix-turn-helix transcriptional regulator [Frankia sp. QA3]|uniref:MarR family winged helix-turn-helix transcriptional regulator n=1 Tax=Frankia sp. QA3 TaxID=710111 RepID=UPI000269C981|nr:MarR family transcriptional regulator [Frankia sp. QA3]EIV93755.1 transcriptional regulator [Frankia sp. QA3]